MRFLSIGFALMACGGEPISLKDQSLRKIKFNKMKFISEKILFKSNIGRIRDIKIHKSGDIYLLSDKGELWRMYK